jgi:integrase
MAQEAITAIAEMTTAMQRKYIDWRRSNSVGRKAANGELSDGTINKDLEVLRAALRFWQREGHVAEVPHVRLLKKPQPRQRFLTPEEVELLLDHCVEDHLYLFVMLCLHTLQRPGAILELTCEQVDLKSGRIDFNTPGRSQTTKRRPVVPITSTLRPLLERAMAQSVTGYVVEYLAAPVFSLRRSFKTACANAGLNDVSPYTLRHTGATLLAAAGVPLWQISGMLGHSLSKTTEIYAKHAPGFLGDAADALDVVYRRSGR